MKRFIERRFGLSLSRWLLWAAFVCWAIGQAHASPCLDPQANEYRYSSSRASWCTCGHYFQNDAGVAVMSSSASTIRNVTSCSAPDESTCGLDVNDIDFTATNFRVYLNGGLVGSIVSFSCFWTAGQACSDLGFGSPCFVDAQSFGPMPTIIFEDNFESP